MSGHNETVSSHTVVNLKQMCYCSVGYNSKRILEHIKDAKQQFPKGKPTSFIVLQKNIKSQGVGDPGQTEKLMGKTTEPAGAMVPTRNKSV